MSRPMAYLRPSTLQEALSLLDELGSQAAVLAGGTDLLVEARQGKLKASCFVDIGGIEELKAVELRGSEVRLGAGVSFSEIVSSQLLKEHAPVLVQAASTVGSPQIRNVATVGGNVVHCSPCADSVPALLVHEARAVLRSSKGSREVPLESFLLGPYRSAIGSGEILTEFVLKSLSGLWASFQKVARRRELAIARLSLAVVAQTVDGVFASMRIALGSATPAPKRMSRVEEFLLGRAAKESNLWEAGRILAQEMIGASGIRASTAYKEKAVQGLLVRSLFPLMSHET